MLDKRDSFNQDGRFGVERHATNKEKPSDYIVVKTQRSASNWNENYENIHKPGRFRLSDSPEPAGTIHISEEAWNRLSVTGPFGSSS